MQDIRQESRQDIRLDPARAQERLPGAAALESGLGAWASAISADDNAQAAIALAEAINRARTTQASRENRAADARVIAVGRLETLRARLAPIYAAIPRDVELFDLGVVGHEPPRLFVDIIAFIEMAEDRRSFRLMQETRSGRVLLGETTDEKRMAALVTDYIAVRLVERERALAARGVFARPEPLPKAVVEPAALAGPARPPDAPAPEPALAQPEAKPAPAGSLVAAPTLAAQPAAAAPSPSASPAPPAAVKTAALAGGAVAAAAAAQAVRRQQSGGWAWPLVALVVGVALGALLLYLYAASLARP